MMKSDVIVIGAGVSGLTAAAVAASKGLSVTVLAKGAGTLAFGGGMIDVLGYVGGRGLRNPVMGIDRLTDNHPYTLAGKKGIEDALQFFQGLCTEAAYPLDGSLETNIWIPTIAGTMKPSCLVPKTMNASDLPEAKKIILIHFDGLKDFYPEMIKKELQTITGLADKEYSIATVDTKLAKGRDITNLDIARWLETPEGQTIMIEQLEAEAKPGCFLLMPPVLGTVPSYDIWQRLQERLGCRIIEMVAPPPAVSGSRMRAMLKSILKKKNVTIVEQANVRRAEIKENKCCAVVTRHFGREKAYQGRAFILATGGFLGGGLVAEPQCLREPIFDLPVADYADAETQADCSLLDCPAVFQSGVRVNSQMSPVDPSGNIIFNNVYAAGNIIAGYDYCTEKSGNGVAVVTAYTAARSAIGGIRL